MEKEPLLTLEFEYIGEESRKAEVGLYRRDSDSRNRTEVFRGFIDKTPDDAPSTVATKALSRYVKNGDYSGIDEKDRPILEALRGKDRWNVGISNTRIVDGKIRMDVDVFGD